GWLLLPALRPAPAAYPPSAVPHPFRSCGSRPAKVAGVQPRIPGNSLSGYGPGVSCCQWSWEEKGKPQFIHFGL
ncbi:MAG: hypothetical protein AVDCRST_MAG56-5792, partial [uncultured Cytophagales bacterium]